MTQVLTYLSYGCFHTNHSRTIPVNFLYSQNNRSKTQLCAHYEYIYKVFFLFAASHQKLIQHIGACDNKDQNCLSSLFWWMWHEFGSVSCCSHPVYLGRFLLFPSIKLLKARTIHNCNLLIIYFFAWLEKSSSIKWKLWICSLQTSRHLTNR